MKTIAAIDPSLTSTGVCYGSNGGDFQVHCCGSKPKGKAVSDRVHRYEGLISQIELILTAAKPALILIEEYAYSKNMGGQMYLGEFGGLLRWHLIEHTPHVFEVTASCLKKFATGKGNAKKEMVMAHVNDRYHKIFRNSDECDAFVLYNMGLCLAGRQEPATQAQRESVSKVLSDSETTSADLAAACNQSEVPF